MITVKGFRYYNDNNCPKMEKTFENLGQLLYFIEQNALSKKRVYLPAQNSDGTFNQQFARTFSGHLSYADEKRYHDEVITSHIELIKDNDTGKIIFSSGSLTDGKGHISTPMKDMISSLKAWTEAEYVFAE